MDQERPGSAVVDDRFPPPTPAQAFRLKYAADLLRGFTEGIDGNRLTALMDWAFDGVPVAGPGQKLLDIMAAPWAAAGEAGEFAGNPYEKGREDLDRVNRQAMEQCVLHSATADLIDRFAQALKDKLAGAEVKYGYSDEWLRDDWRDELVARLLAHVEKGDPRDVAAYCAFAYHHGWSIAPDRAKAPPLTGQILQQAFADTFQGGGWIESPDWADFDDDQKARWDRAAWRLAEIIRPEDA